MDNRDMIRMANQIASFFNGEGTEPAVRDTAEHINKFWEPRMRLALLAYNAAGGEGLDPTVRAALAQDLIRRPNTAAA